MNVGVGVDVELMVASVAGEADKAGTCNSSTAVTVDANDEVVASASSDSLLAGSSDTMPPSQRCVSTFATDVFVLSATRLSPPFSRNGKSLVAATDGVDGADSFPTPIAEATFPASPCTTGLVGAELGAIARSMSFAAAVAAAAAAAAAASLSSTRFAIATIRLAKRSNVRVISRITWLTFQLSRLPSAISAYVRSLPLAKGSGRRKTCVTLWPAIGSPKNRDPDPEPRGKFSVERVRMHERRRFEYAAGKVG